MTITLDDVQCLLHVSIVGKLLTFPQKVTILDGVKLMIELLGMDQELAEKEARDCGGSYIRASTLGTIYLWHSAYVYYVLEYGEDPDGLFEHCNHCMIRCFLLYFLGHTLFTNKSKKHLDLMYVELLRDVYTIGEYAWGAIGLAVLYHNLNEATRIQVKTCGGYLSLLLAWAMEHFLAYFISDRNSNYTPSMPCASRYLGQNRGHKYPQHYREILDGLELSAVVWTPYEDHRRFGYPISEVCWFSGWIMAHKKKTICKYLAERVQRQFGRVQVIPESPNHVVAVDNLDETRSRFFDFAMHAVPHQNRGREARDPWEFVPGYMLWFERYSHPRILPFVEGREEPTPI